MSAPSSLWLLGSGLAALALVGLWRRLRAGCEGPRRVDAVSETTARRLHRRYLRERGYSETEIREGK